MKPANKIFNLLNLHFAVLGLLAALNLFLCVRLIGAWHTFHSDGPEQVEQIGSSYRTLDLQTRPLRGLPGKVEQARSQSTQFYDDRFPSAYSTISATLSDLAGKNNIRLSHLAYSYAPAIPGLTEIRMDASLSGQYESLMHLINGLERSKTFFVIDGLTFTGEQGGLVNLRLKLTTYMRASDLDRTAPPPDNQATSVSSAASPGFEEAALPSAQEDNR